MNEYVDLYSAH